MSMAKAVVADARSQFAGPSAMLQRANGIFLHLKEKGWRRMMTAQCLELDCETGKFRLAGKEFQMIELLMSNPGVLISTDRFMDKIWGLDSDADINVVWTYLSYLRKKLAALDAHVIIKATRNAGYSLEETK